MKIASFCLSVALALFLSNHASAVSVLKISPNSTVRAGSEVEADYTTTHLFIDEVAGDSIPITIFFDPGIIGVESAEVFTNLNRRDRADDDANSDGIEDGILPPNGNNIPAGNDSNYFKAHTMALVSGGYQITLYANKTGAYRLTARYRLNGDSPGTYRYYNDSDGGGKRDHCFVLSPVDSRKIRLYEVNAFNVEATGDTFAQRSTLEDLHNATGAPHNANNRWDLDYLTELGCNWLWFQPIHPNGIDGREIDPSTSSPYDPGSPYAVKNFFEVNVLMTKNYSGGNTQSQNRAASMTAFQNFVTAADLKGVGVMLDAPFNHTAFDVELAQKGVELFSNGSTPTTEIRNSEARFFSQTGNYGARASSAGNIAPGPDRFDFGFGKWNDVKDVFFGRYDALVEIDAEPERSSYSNEGDWFDYTTASGNFDGITRGVWKYFAEYALFWLAQTGVPAGSDLPTQTANGIDGLRADFGQGLPPQCWEYIINRARDRKWNFVFMSESLDGGNVTYRSARQFDVLNENIVFSLKNAFNKYDYQTIFEDRRNAYGQALVLLNSTSHDEESFSDPWQSVLRSAVTGSIDGVTLVFPGQELGISTAYGYDHYELNIGKQIPHFKRWNSMQPIWNDSNFGNDQLHPVYSGILSARKGSPALRSSNRWFLNGDGGNDKIFAVAKYEEANASPAFKDVVLAFANVDRDNTHSDNFKIPAGLAPLLGLKDGRTYNVKNIAAYIGQQSNRRDLWLWGGGITGSALKSTGFFASLYKVPATPDDPGTPGINEAQVVWTNEPYEAQYLRLYDVTPPPSPAPEAPYYMLGTEVVFTWTPNAGPDDNVVSYSVVVKDGNGDPIASGTVTDGSNQFAFTGTPGTIYYATITATSVAGVNSSSPVSSDAGAPNPASATTPVKLLDPLLDDDGDGQSNGSEASAGTNPLSSASVLKATASEVSGNDVLVTVATIAGKSYQLETSTSLAPVPWTLVGDVVTATGSSTIFIHPGGAGDPQRFYRIRVVP